VIPDGAPFSDAKDALHQVTACAAAAAFLNKRKTGEWLDRRRAAYGPGAMSPKEWALRGDAANDAAGGAASSGDPLPALGAEMDSLEALAAAAYVAGVPSASDEISKKLVEVEDRAAELKPESLAGSIVLFRVLRRLAQDHDWNETMDRIADNLIAGLEDVASQWPGRVGKTGGAT
jgi:hypothetical protein